MKVQQFSDSLYGGREGAKNGPGLYKIKKGTVHPNRPLHMSLGFLFPEALKKSAKKPPDQ